MKFITSFCFGLAFMLTAVGGAYADEGSNGDNDLSFDTLQVQGRAEAFYLDTDSNIGSKIDLDIVDLPQSAQVLSKQLIIDQGAQDITDLYRSIAGVSEFSYSGVMFRGFRDSSNLLYDGVRGDPYSGFSVPRLFNVERVEVIKGPSASLYGAGEPAGFINYVTKKPSFERKREVVLTSGSHDMYGTSFDSTGKWADKLAYRLGGFFQQEDTFRNNVGEKNQELAGGLLFLLSDYTELTTTFDYVDQELDGHRLRGVPTDKDGNFVVGRRFNTNERSDYQNLQALVLQADLKHIFDDTLSMNATWRYLDNKRRQGYHEPYWLARDVNGDGVRDVSDGGILRRQYRLQYRANKEYSLTLDFVKKLRLAGMDHQLLFGSDYHDIDTEYDYFRANGTRDGVPNLNIYNPVYGQADPSTYRLRNTNRYGAKTNRYSVYLQNYTTLSERWRLMLGARYDRFEDETKKPRSLLRSHEKSDHSDSKVSPRVGLSYKPAMLDNGNIYLNYSESFNPISLSRQSDGGSLNSETGEQWEVGFKQEFFDGQMLGTVALYQITKKDMAVSNPASQDSNDGIPDYVTLGKVKSEGVELTLVGDITPDWTITANYAWNDVRVTQFADGQQAGNTIRDSKNPNKKKQFVNAPEHQAGLWTRYALRQIDSSVGFGMKYVSERFNFNDQRIKPYTIFDANWTTEWDQLTMQVNIYNLFDRTYAVSGFLNRPGHFPGAPREIVLQLRYNFD